ncbi:MAG: glycosyltransferase family 39 protein, partial [Chloroflexia bacterium]|nr:glycosyltransferase family 39 protein [Chloroflexia bacterium]
MATHTQQVGSMAWTAAERPSDQSSTRMMPWQRALPTRAIVVMLYILAVGLSLAGPGGLPDYTYNWEHYTADDLYRFYDGDRPLRESFSLTDGLMTDSGESPFLTIPTLALWQLIGPGLWSMRLVAVVISALAVPMLWLLARRLFDPWVATGAAGLLLLSPAFLLYARTATIVGLSVGIGIATAFALL